MGFLTPLYRLVFKRNSTAAVAIIGGAFLFERAFDQGVQALYDEINKGVSTRHISLMNICVNINLFFLPRSSGKISNIYTRVIKNRSARYYVEFSDWLRLILIVTIDFES